MKYSDVDKTVDNAIYFKESLSNLFNIYNKDGINFFNINRTFVIDIPKEVEKNYVTYYIASENEFWTNISYKHYQSIRYWWLICKVNGITNPTIGPKSGQVIKILSPDYINGIVDSLQNG